ncbi:hypothetical protein KIM372_16980 [Bombiscardovia nodaiensis]|uniref:GP-PDE domain-containing protein n=1 Tax=Bombiscardovia nodaiensis TaxID=2932181 RepID=A0ABN6SF16_9BIFI|nr:hypothetical protein KIM372_16980 [Bombiscardovia nodaiensis]
MGSIGRIAKAGEALVGAGFAAAALGIWAVAPRSEAMRKLQGASGVPGAYFAHRGLHDAGSGIAPDRAKADRDQRDYIALAEQLTSQARHSNHSAVAPDAVTQNIAATQAGGRPAALAPENSLAAFAAAAQIGYGIELDVHLTRDGQVVVVHDDDLQRVAGDPRKVSDLTYEELQTIPLSRAADAPYTPGEGEEQTQVSGSPARTHHGRHARRAAAQPELMHVPLLTDVLRLVAGRVPLIVEYKMGAKLERELMEKTDALLAAYTGPYVIESFNPLAVAWYRQHRPGVCRGQLASPYHGPVRSGGSWWRRWRVRSCLTGWGGPISWLTSGTAGSLSPSGSTGLSGAFP